MKVVIDTNVFISGIFFNGPPHTILKLWKMEIINVPDLSPPVCDDPDDDKFIAAALASNCPIIISGDKYLPKISGFKEIEVLKPREFLEKYF
jgi:predicted nucleic acid-binding protein